MWTPPTSIAPPSAPRTGYQRLALAVLDQAAKDLATHKGARRWVTYYTDDVAWWCAVAGVPVDRYRAYVRERIAHR